MNARETGLALCEALGLDPNRVTSIVLRWTADDVPRVRVTLIDIDGTDIVRTIGRYRLEPISWSVPVRTSTTVDGESAHMLHLRTMADQCANAARNLPHKPSREAAHRNEETLRWALEQLGVKPTGDAA